MSLANNELLRAWVKRGSYDPLHRIVKHDTHHALEKEVEKDFWVEVDRIDKPAYWRCSHNTLLWLCGERQEKFF